MADHPQAMGELRRLLAAREPLYATADHTVDTSRVDAASVARTVERVASGRGARRRRASGRGAVARPPRGNRSPRRGV